ncbi:MAG: DUF4405 domain-containing protein [Clostridiales bacterium]|nr:DUF4405 domain-containing protein [Clostridiales bacterium]
MKVKNRIKLALDVVMLVVLLLMYKKDVLGLGFHEIGGIALCGLFIIHKLLSGKWILVVTGKLFSKKTAWRCKLNWLIDFLQLLCFAYILVSGILISKVLFDGARGASAFKTAHYAVSALALLLTGVHIGLHYEWIVKRMPLRRLPLLARRISAIVISVVILGFGVYQMTATSFLTWMGELGTAVTLSQPPEEDTGNLAEAEPAAGLEEEHAEGGHGSGPRDGQGKGLGNGKGAAADLEVHAEYLGDVLLGFLSITLAFSAAVAWIDGAQRAAKRMKLLKCNLPG